VATGLAEGGLLVTEATNTEVVVRLVAVENRFEALDSKVENLTEQFALLRRSDDDLRDLLQRHVRKADTVAEKADRLVSLISLRSENLDVLVSGMDGLRAQIAEINEVLRGLAKHEGVPNA
jgi:prefoldin subunit 5